MDVRVTVKSLNDSFTESWSLEDLPEFLTPDEVMREAVHETDRVYGFASDLYIDSVMEV